MQYCLYSYAIFNYGLPQKPGFEGSTVKLTGLIDKITSSKLDNDTHKILYWQKLRLMYKQ